MRSSSSSRFAKESHSTGFDFEPQLGQASFALAQSIDEFDLEQSCLLRLKAQRQKIEELTKLYQDKERELASKNQKEVALLAEIERLSEMAEYRAQWESLKRDYESLVKRFQSADSELTALRKELQGMASNSCDESEYLMKEIRCLKEQRLLSDTHWQEILADKEEQLKKEGRAAQEREYELCQKIQALSERVETLEELLSERQEELDSKSECFRKELGVREEDLLAFEKVIESFKKQNSEYKAKIIAVQQCAEKEKGELLEAVEQLRGQVKLLRRGQLEKENEVYEFKEAIKKSDAKNQALESAVCSLRSNLKKLKENTDSSLKKMSSSTEEERTQLELFIHELKAELQRQMEEKSEVYAEVRRLRGQLQRREQQEKQRKLLLMSEFREIDKMEKMVKKII